MAAVYAVVTQALTATASGTTDLTSSGFGTPTAAILLFSSANSTNNPQSSGSIGVGLWDGTNQRGVSVYTEDNVADSNAYRAQRDDYAVVAASASSASTVMAFGYTASAITDGLRLTLSVDNTGVQRYCTAILIKGVSAKVTTVTPNATQNSTAASSSLGFAPSLLVATTTGHTGNSPNSGAPQLAPAVISFGAASSDGTHRMSAWSAANVSATAANTALFSETRCVGQIAGGALSWAGEITTWGADTFTVTTRDGGSGSDVFYALALGGADLEALIGTITTATSTGAVDTTTTGIDPAALLLAMTSSDTAGTIKTDSQSNSLSFGAASSTVEAGFALVDEDGAGTINSESSYSSTKTLHMRASASGTTSTLIEADASLGAEKFTLDYTTVSGTARKGWYLALGTPSSGGTANTTVSLSTGYAIRASGSASLAAAYAIRGAITASLSSGFAIRSTASAALAAGYAINSSASASLATGWPIRSSTTSALATGWEIESAAGALTVALSTAYAIRSSATQALAAGYAVRDLHAGISLPAGWAIRASTEVPLSTGWAIDTPAGTLTVSLATGWAITGTATVALAAGWAVDYPAGGADPAAVWAYVMSNGQTAEANVLAIRTLLESLPATAIADAVWAKVLA